MEEEALQPQYGGGMIVIPEFNENGSGGSTSVPGWSATSGKGKNNNGVEIRTTKGGNKFAVSHNPPYHISQNLNLETTMLYTFSGAVQNGPFY